MDLFDPKIVTFALMATTLVNIVVNIARMAADMPRWVPPTMALVLGFLMVLVLMIAAGDAIDRQRMAQALIAGILSAGASAGVTTIAERAHVARHPEHLR